MRSAFEKYGLKEIEFSGFLPTYCLSRQGVMFDYIARFIEAAIVKPLDRGSGNAVSRLFGFEFWIKGTKREEGQTSTSHNSSQQKNHNITVSSFDKISAVMGE